MFKDGVVNLWNLPIKRTYITLEENFKNRMIKVLLEIYKTKYQIQKQLGISRKTILEISKIKNRKVRLDIILKIIDVLKERGYEEFEIDNLQSKVIWIGAPQGNGIDNPKLPFDFTTSAGARFLSAISGDGSITSGNNMDNIKNMVRYSYGALFYINTDKELRNSVINDARTIFGGTNITTLFNDIYIIFSFICRDTIEVITDFKGTKSENNPHTPPFIFTDKKLMCGWIEQVIADEGDVRYYPEQYERSITWRRCVDITNIFEQFEEDYKIASNKSKVLQKIGEIAKCNLIEGERKMLNNLGISLIVKPIEIYFTKKEKVRLKWEIRISGKENLKKLRKLIRIPHRKKDKRFNVLLNSYK